MANCFHEKQKVGWAARMTLLSGPTLPPYRPFGLPCRVNSVKARQSWYVQALLGWAKGQHFSHIVT